MVGNKSGTGMGLYIVKTSMEKMQGRVVASNSPEGGAMFTLYFAAEQKNALEITDDL